MNNNDCYSALGVSPTATPAQIKERYRYLSHAFHPDKFSTDTKRKSAEEDFKQINQAYQVLFNSAERAQYDASRSPRPASAPPPRSQHPPPKPPPPSPQPAPTKSVVRSNSIPAKSVLLERLSIGFTLILGGLGFWSTGFCPPETGMIVFGIIFCVIGLVVAGMTLFNYDRNA